MYICTSALSSGKPEADRSVDFPEIRNPITSKAATRLCRSEMVMLDVVANLRVLTYMLSLRRKALGQSPFDPKRPARILE